MNNSRKRVICFLGIVFGLYSLAWLLAVVLPGEAGKTVYEILKFPVVFMGVPLLAVLVTRKVTRDKSPWHFSLKVWKKPKMLLFSALLPALAVFMGIALFYLLFPSDLDYSGSYLSQNFAVYGAPTDLQLTVPTMLLMGFIVVLISAVAIPSGFFALGEDIGWQGYLLPLLCKLMPTKLAVLLNGALWGLGHAPLIYFGYNYGSDYTGAPLTGIGMMILFCMVMGIWMSYTTIRTKNCMYAAIIHGSVNIIGETGVFVSLATKSPLLGPNPTGIISLIVLLAGSLILLFRMPAMKTDAEN